MAFHFICLRKRGCLKSAHFFATHIYISAPCLSNLCLDPFFYACVRVCVPLCFAKRPCCATSLSQYELARSPFAFKKLALLFMLFCVLWSSNSLKVSPFPFLRTIIIITTTTPPPPPPLLPPLIPPPPIHSDSNSNRKITRLQKTRTNK